MAAVNDDVQITRGNQQVRIGGSHYPDELAKELKDPTKFREFADDPQKFVARHGITIDQNMAQQLKTQVGTAKNSDEFEAAVARGGAKPQATIIAIAKGALAHTSSKIALAF
jgi:hypothetical protein